MPRCALDGDCRAGLVGGVERPEAGGRNSAFQHVAALALQEVAVGIPLRDEAEPFRAPQRQQTLPRDTRARIGIGIGRADVWIGRPAADGDGADALARLQSEPDAGRAAPDGDSERDEDEQRGLQHAGAAEKRGS